MTAFVKGRNKGSGVLVLEGDLTVQRADEMREALMKALAGADAVELDLGGVTGADLSCLQLLCSAHRTAIRMSKKIGISANKAEVFRRVVEDSGFSRHTGCVGQSGSCLWLKEEHHG